MPVRSFVLVLAVVVFASACSSASAPNSVLSARPGLIAATAIPEIIVTQTSTGTAAPKVLTFRQTDAGDVAPLRSIDGSGAGALSFSGVAVGPSGNLYVADPSDEQVIVYAKSASGPAAPLFTITCAFTNPSSIAFDLRDRMYVSSGVFSISILPATASGCVSGNASIAGGHTELYNPQGIYSAPTGRLFVLNISDSVTEYAPGSTGNVGWTHDIRGASTELDAGLGCGDAIFVARDVIYVVDENSRSITEYAIGANRDAPPIREIEGPMTGLRRPTAITVDDAGEIFVANAGNASITVYAAGAHGDAAPERTIEGPDTQLTQGLVGIARDH